MPREIRGRAFWDVFIADDERDDVIGRFAAAAPNHPAVEYENTFVNNRGEQRVIFWRSAPLKDDQGATRGIIVGGSTSPSGTRSRRRASSSASS